MNARARVCVCVCVCVCERERERRGGGGISICVAAVNLILIIKLNTFHESSQLTAISQRMLCWHKVIVTIHSVEDFSFI